MMGEEEEKNPYPIYIVGDLVEDILVGLPLKQILRFKTVSKQWRSILESKSFAEKRKRRVQQDRKILAVGDRTEPRFEGDAEIEMVYLQRDDVTTRPSLTCDGLVCIPVPDWINVLNPSTGEFRRFPSGPSHYGPELFAKFWWDKFPGYWAMGFGKDQVNGSYKIVRMLFDFKYFEILDVHIGQWRKLSPAPYKVYISKQGSLFLYFNDKKMLFKYYPDSDHLCCVSRNICVISSFVENLVPLGLQPGCVRRITTSGYQNGLSYLQPGCVPETGPPAYQSRVSSIVGRIELMIPNILLTSTLVSLIIFGYRYKYCT